MKALLREVHSMRRRNMDNKTHPDAYVPWADAYRSTTAYADPSPQRPHPEAVEQRREMGAPYPTERGGTRITSSPHSKALPDETRVVHPIWTPRAPTVLSPTVIRQAQDLDRALRLYTRKVV